MFETQLRSRIAAVLVALVLSVLLENLWGFSRLFSLLLGVLAYLIVRYLGYFVRERRYIRNVTDEALKNQNSGNQISN
jgi:membrane protein implicated in regulation of membrane protease activity